MMEKICIALKFLIVSYDFDELKFRPVGLQLDVKSRIASMKYKLYIKVHLANGVAFVFYPIYIQYKFAVSA
jgi:hypothetical protein